MRKKCTCGSVVVLEFEPPFQEYPGARVWGGDWSGECPKCEELLSVKDKNGYEPRENTRGY